METRKITILLLVLITISNLLTAQEKELAVRYKYERSVASLGGEDNNEIILQSLPPFNVRVDATKEWSVREIDPVVTGTFTKNGQLVSQDTICNYVKISYMDACVQVPVFRQFSVIGQNFTMLLKEPLGLFLWKIEAESKTILGYQCNKASCSFRGRKYIAYFTREVPFKAAPWKFHGLPGVVMEVYSTDDYCKWTAQSLSIKQRKTERSVSFDDLQAINLQQYIKMLKKRRLESIEIAKKELMKFPDSKSLKIDLKELEINLPRDIEIFDLN
ncbi:GLPGLI family protein [Marinifilum sp.]|uniref:GLPGLI family protein n=1 Tax=Marinifilum sp. TaxID=2033137 RepID=UPI003BABBC35